jgi:ABC-type nitrate/sulfonate/bicarbonate transport system permease component
MCITISIICLIIVIGLLRSLYIRERTRKNVNQVWKDFDYTSNRYKLPLWLYISVIFLCFIPVLNIISTIIIVITLLISIVTTIISVLTGFNEVDSGKMRLMDTFQANKWQKLKYLIFPASVPIFISALKINVGLSWVGVIMGEFLVAREGLGFLIIYGGQIAQLDMVMMSIVILSIIAFIMYKIVSIFEVKVIKKNE